MGISNANERLAKASVPVPHDSSVKSLQLESFRSMNDALHVSFFNDSSKSCLQALHFIKFHCLLYSKRLGGLDVLSAVHLFPNEIIENYTEFLKQTVQECRWRRFRRKRDLSGFACKFQNSCVLNIMSTKFVLFSGWSLVMAQIS